MKLKTKVIISSVVYILFMIYFMGVFLPMFTENVGGNEMLDVYLVDYSKSIDDIGNLILDYGEVGREFMTNFFIMDSMYVVISACLFYLLVKLVTKDSKLVFIPLLAGFFDTIENIIVLYSGNTLNMNYLLFARIFASMKAFCLLMTLIIIVINGVRLLKQRKKRIVR